MRMAIKDGDIIIQQVTSDQYQCIKSWNLMRWVRSEQALHGKATVELLNKLTVFGKLPEHIEAVRVKLGKKREAIDKARNAEEPTPLVDYPVKVKLFKHQVRGANMALLAFGFDPEKGGFDE